LTSVDVRAACEKEPVVDNSITHVALDAHKAKHQGAVLYPDTDGARPEEFTVYNEPARVRRMVERIVRKAPGRVLFCYEAGVCGFALQRQIVAAGAACMVIAPSLVPIRPGERVKTDRRDARKLVRLLRQGALVEVRPPSEAEESVRELCRCREAAQGDLNRTRHRLSKFLLRRGLAWHEGNQWTQRHMRWVRGVKLEQACDKEVLVNYLSELDHREQRVSELVASVGSVAQTEPYRQAVGWLRCFHGIDTITAMTWLSELHGFARFGTPRSLMAFVGVVPSEDSSGARQRKGGITKAGNGRVRRALTETAWQYARSGVAGKPLRRRRKNQPAWVIQIACKAHRRLHKRYWHLVHRGKTPCTAAMAIGRELVGFVWSVLRWVGTDGPPWATAAT
jgi:transposase